MTRYVAYYRVSTKMQGQSGLGLAAQRSDVQRYAGDAVLTSYQDIESGRRPDRPQLLRAMDHAQSGMATS